MSFSFCFSPMRRAALFALAFSLGQGENLFSGSCGIRCRQYFLLSGICDTRCRQCFLLFWRCGIRYRQCLLLSAVCGIRYRREPSMVRNMRAVLKTGSWGTRRIFRGIRCKKQAFPVQKGYSVRRTASRGTRRIMDIRCSPPSLVRNRSLDAKKGHHRNNTKKQDKSCDLSCLVAGAGLEPTTSGL